MYLCMYNIMSCAINTYDHDEHKCYSCFGKLTIARVTFYISTIKIYGDCSFFAEYSRGYVYIIPRMKSNILNFWPFLFMSFWQFSTVIIYLFSFLRTKMSKNTKPCKFPQIMSSLMLNTSGRKALIKGVYFMFAPWSYLKSFKLCLGT